MKKHILTIVAAAAVSFSALAQTANEVIDKHVAAVGGLDKINAIKTAQYDQSINMMGMDMTAKTTVQVGQSSRTEVSVMGQQIISVIDGDKGWSINPMQGGPAPVEMSADQVKMSKGNTEVTGMQLAYAKMRNYPTKLVGKEKYQDKDVFNVEVTRPEGIVNYYVDASTYQILGTKAVVNAPQGQTMEVKANFGDFKQVEGLTMPHKVEITSPALPSAMTTQVTKVTLNPTVDAAIFAMPK